MPDHRWRTSRRCHIASDASAASPITPAEGRAAHHQLADSRSVGVCDRRLHAGQGEPDRPRAAVLPRAGWTASTASRTSRSAREPIPRSRRRTAATDRPRGEPIRRRRAEGPTARPPGRTRPTGGTWWGPRRTWCSRARRRGRGSGTNRSKHDGGTACGQRAEQPRAQPVHVKKRQGQEQAVVGPPTPGHLQGQAFPPAANRGCGPRPSALRSCPRCTRSVHRPRAPPHPTRRLPRPHHRGARRVLQHHRPGRVARQPFPALGPIDHADRRIHVSRHVAQLAPAGGRVDGDDDGAETQRAEEDDDRVQRRASNSRAPGPPARRRIRPGMPRPARSAAPAPGHAARRRNCAPPGEPDGPVRHATVATTPRAVCGRWSDQPAARAAHLVVGAGTDAARHVHHRTRTPVSEPPHAIVWRT